MPAAVSASATPATSGASGPTTTSETPRSAASAHTASGSHGSSPATVSTSRAMPALPGAHRIRGRRADRASARTIACSRAPPPSTSTVASFAKLHRPDEVVDRDRGERLVATRSTRAELQRDPRDRLRVRRLDHVDEVVLAERRPLGGDGRAERLDLAVDLADPPGVVLDRLDPLGSQLRKHDVGRHGSADSLLAVSCGCTRSWAWPPARVGALKPPRGSVDERNVSQNALLRRVAGHEFTWIGGAFVALVLVAYLVLQSMLTGTFDRLESQEARSQAARIATTLGYERKLISNTVGTNGEWD